jgi:glycosyltransferase involved in cell wall biosynthesis
MVVNSPKIIFVVNSFINKPGNIGLRIGKLINAYNGYKEVYSRGAQDVDCNVHTMGFLGHLPRLLNAFRIYIYRGFKSRLYDLKLFELFMMFHHFFDRRDLTGYIVHLAESSEYLARYYKQKGCKVIVDVPIAPSSYVDRNIVNSNGSFPLESTGYMLKYEVGAYKYADFVVAPSEFVRSELLKIGVRRGKIIVIPFGTNISIAKLDRNNKGNSDSVDFVFAGAVNQRKGIHILLDVWNDKAFKDDRLHLCGRVYPEIKSILKKNDINNVITPGFVDVSKYFSSCDVYVFPSLLEGSSKSIYEAMSAGLPVITTFESGSIITDGLDGFIIRKLDKESLRTAMLEFKHNKSLIEDMGKKAEISVKDFTWENYTRRCFEVYQKL